jgi:hypothetical protein
MKVINTIIIILVFCNAGCGAAKLDLPESALVFHGASDASAAVALGKDTFIVADDENNTLRIYKTKNKTLPVSSFDMTKFLGTTSVHPEADIEAATMIDDRIYWITSHGRNKDGKPRQNRYRFFATTVKAKDKDIVIEPAGTPCKDLLHKLVETEKTKELGLQQATRFNAKLKKKQRKKLAPKVNGLNIEGLCASHDKKSLYIAFRNPIPVDKKNSIAQALLIPLKNYEQVIDKNNEPVFGEPILWDLNGLGIRSMEYSAFHKAYFIVAGPHTSRREFVLYKWSGKKDDKPVPVRKIESDNNDFTPEALITFKDSDKLLLLSDDGTLLADVSSLADCMEGELLDNGKCPNKYLTNPNQKFFKGTWLKP